MGPDKLKTIGKRIVEEFLNKANIEVANEIFASDFINHNPSFGTEPDLKGFKEFIKNMHDAFSELHVSANIQIEEHSEISGTSHKIVTL
jgi:hypothetical protein